MDQLRGAPIILLAGGFGTRIQSVLGKTPKILAPIANKKCFLDFQLENLYSQGIRQVILSLYHESNQVIRHVSQSPLKRLLEIRSVVEPKPLDTGGAVNFVLQESGISGRFFVMNGDTFLPTGIREIQGSSAANTLAAVFEKNTARFGTIVSNSSGLITCLEEKKGSPTPGMIYAGLARLNTNDFETFRPSKARFSLERDFFPELVRQKRLDVSQIKSAFTDIGIPVDYEKFQTNIQLDTFGGRQKNSSLQN